MRLSRTNTHKFTGIFSAVKRHTKQFSEKANMSELFNAALKQLSNLKLVSGEGSFMVEKLVID